jgi:transposase InsO family protein
VKVLRSDRWTKYTNKKFTEFLNDKDIKQELTVPYAPEQNGASEKENRTIIEAVKSMLHAANVHICFWEEAAQTAVYTLNRCRDVGRLLVKR